MSIKKGDKKGKNNVTANFMDYKNTPLPKYKPTTAAYFFEPGKYLEINLKTGYEIINVLFITRIIVFMNDYAD